MNISKSSFCNISNHVNKELSTFDSIFLFVDDPDKCQLMKGNAQYHIELNKTRLLLFSHASGIMLD